MHLLPHLLICVLSSTALQAGQTFSAEEKPEDKQQQVTIIVQPSTEPTTVNVNNTSHNENRNKATSSPVVSPVISLTNSIKNSATSWLSNKLAQHNLQITDIHPSELARNGSLFIFEHKKKFFCGAALALYCGTATILFTGNRYLSNPKRWCNWKCQMSVEEMQLCTQKQLQADLVVQIQRRYLNPQNPTDKLTPLITFMKVIDREMVVTTRYLTVGNTINRCRLARFFPVNDQKLERGQEKKQRLTFIKHIFVSWAAQHNFETL